MSSRLENIYNQNYGKTVVTNGNFIAVGNPPSLPYDSCEGISRTGQVFLIKRDNFNSNYKLVKVLKKDAESTKFILPTYYTEQSSSTVYTASFVSDSGSLKSTNNSCSYLVIEDGNVYTYQSTYGSTIDMCNHFLATGDTGISSSYIEQQFNYACVDVYVVNPNYVYNNTTGVTTDYSIDVLNLDTYIPESSPLCTITGSISEGFGSSVSITNNYLAVGAPKFNNNRGAVYLYKYSDEDCIYTLEKILSASTTNYPHQFNYGFSIALDKTNENVLVVGSNQISQSNVYVYFKGDGDEWSLVHAFSQNTSSKYYETQPFSAGFYPSGSQINTRFGYSVSVDDRILAVGAPNDLIYYEYSGSNTLRQRGAVYIYTNRQCVQSGSVCDFNLSTKIYGNNSTFKDNLFGYSLSIFDNKLLIGSPKPYFPFSSLFVSSSINYYDQTFDENDNGETTYCGQSLLYQVEVDSYLSGSSKSINLIDLTSQPIGKRKEIGKPFSAFAYSVSVSDKDLVIGSPIPLNDDFYLSGLLLTESGSALSGNYIETSSFQSEDCDIPSKFVYFQMEEYVNCECALSGALISPTTGSIVFVDEQGPYLAASENIFGKSYIYNLEDLKENYVVGNVFYNNNTIIINNTGSILTNLTLDPTDNQNSNLYMDFKSQLTLFEKQYICTIEPGEFNISTNPTAVTSSTFDYGVINKNVFDFNNLDIILRYINTRITTTKSEKWWANFVEGDIEESIFNFYSSSYDNYNSNRLTNQLKNECSNLNFDVNDDGVCTLQDGTMIWKYFASTLDINNYKNYLTPRSRRQNFDDIINFLNTKTGKNIQEYSLPLFAQFNYSSSIDITGSYLAPYITTVGLYDGSDLVAIAKLAQPIKNTGEIPINIVVKWDT